MRIPGLRKVCSFKLNLGRLQHGNNFDNPSASAGAWIDLSNSGSGYRTLKYGNVVVNGGIAHSSGTFTPATSGLYRVSAQFNAMTYSTSAGERNLGFMFRTTGGTVVITSSNNLTPQDNNAYSVGSKSASLPQIPPSPFQDPQLVPQGERLCPPPSSPSLSTSTLTLSPSFRAPGGEGTWKLCQERHVMANEYIYIRGGK